MPKHSLFRQCCCYYYYCMWFDIIVLLWWNIEITSPSHGRPSTHQFPSMTFLLCPLTTLIDCVDTEPRSQPIYPIPSTCTCSFPRPNTCSLGDRPCLPSLFLTTDLWKSACSLSGAVDRRTRVTTTTTTTAARHLLTYNWPGAGLTHRVSVTSGLTAKATATDYRCCCGHNQPLPRQSTTDWRTLLASN